MKLFKQKRKKEWMNIKIQFTDGDEESIKFYVNGKEVSEIPNTNVEIEGDATSGTIEFWTIRGKKC
jgi:hypothetical protein